jgi:glycosyltransferase involved in cell wall biosynthesis
MAVKNKKVLIILDDLSGGGAERIFVNIANDFNRQGVDTEFLLGKKQGVYFDILEKGTVVHELQAKGFYDYIKKIRSFLKDKPYTHIFTATHYISAAAVLAKKKLKHPAKILATLHYNLPYQLDILPLPQRLWMKYLNGYFLKRADEVIAVSQGVAEGFQKGTGIKRPGIKVIYNPVFDDSIYEKAAENVDHPFFSNGKKTLIYVGRFAEQKNPALLVNAFQLALEERNDIQLLMIGQGALEPEIKRMIRDMQLDDRIDLPGFQRNPFAYISRSDLFVLSSIYEGLPTVLIEALALGINVVSTDCPNGPDEILGQGVYGWLAKNNDAVSLANAIKNALSNPKKSFLLKERAMYFHKKNIIPQYLNLLN